MKNQIFDVQASLDRGETPKTIIDNGAPLESFYGKTYQGGLIFEIKDDGTGKVAALKDAHIRMLWDGAKEYCKGLKLEGYEDWTLPSKETLNLMYENLHTNGLGEFMADLYWSSTGNKLQAWAQLFKNIKPNSNQYDLFTNDNDALVRAVRAF